MCTVISKPHGRQVGHVSNVKIPVQESCTQPGNLIMTQVRSRVFYNSLVSKKNIESLLAKGNKQKALRQGHRKQGKTLNDVTRVKSIMNKGTVKCKNTNVDTTAMSPSVVQHQHVGGNSKRGSENSIAPVQTEQIGSGLLTVTPQKTGFKSITMVLILVTLAIILILTLVLLIRGVILTPKSLKRFYYVTLMGVMKSS